MAERNSFAVSDVGGVLSVADHRLAMGAMWTPGGSNVAAKTGFRPGPTSPGLVTASGTPDGNVHVNPFQLVLQTGRGAADGAYVATLDASKTVSVLSTPAHATFNRRDLIIAQQSDKFYGDASNAFVVKQVVGTPAASPTDPAVTGSTDYVLLARVNVRANTTSILASDVTDLRPSSLYSVAVGGILPVASQTVRDALTGLYYGFAIWRTDRDWLEIWDGSVWRVRSVAVVSGVADLSAISNPYLGQLAVDTNLGAIYRWSGVWQNGNLLYSNTLGSDTGSITVSSIPSTIRTLRVRWSARSSAAGPVDTVVLRVNGNSGPNYYTTKTQANNSTVSQINAAAVTAAEIGVVAGATQGAGVYSNGWCDIDGFDNPHGGDLYGTNVSTVVSGAASTSWVAHGGFVALIGGPWTSLTVLPGSGQWKTGSRIMIEAVA